MSMSKPSSCVVGGRERARSRSQMLCLGKGLFSGEKFFADYANEGKMDACGCVQERGYDGAEDRFFFYLEKGMQGR